MTKRLFAVALFLMLFGGVAQGGIVRHVIRPVVKGSVHVTAKVVKTTAHVAKAIVY
jgi:hypothetical protein